MRTVNIFAFLVLTAIAFAPRAHAQTAPTDCKPNAGATLECTSEITAPYIYLNASCASPQYKSSESASEAQWDAELGSIYTSCPGATLTKIGWASASSPMCLGGGCGVSYPIVTAACVGGPQLFPASSGSGLELNNWLVYQVGGNQNPPSCAPVTPYYLAKVRRERGVLCPQGYSWTGTYCFRGGIDPVKNLGPQCPSCGNPIVPGTGNKFQKEVDYTGGGSYPLTFVRYYNSQQRIGDRDEGYFGSAEFFDRFGNEAWPAIASSQGRAGYAYPAGQDRRNALKWTNLGLDSIGANWRHNYQRSIFYQLNNSSGVSSATAFRHDGKVLTFVQHSGAYYPSEDISDRLTGSPSTGWTYVAAQTDETETYDTDGRLLTIRNRAGSTHTLQYDADGRLQSVSDGLGNTLTFSYSLPAGDPNAVQRITSVTAPGSSLYQYGYGPNATLTSVTYPGGTSRQYQYNGPTARALTGIVDESGVTFATFAYDAYGQATSSAHAGGAGQVTVSYTKTLVTQTGPATITDASGAARTYNYSNIHGVAKVSSIVQPASSGVGTVTESYGYDANGNITSRKDFNDNLTCYAYDATRNLETVRVEGFAPATAACPASLATYTPAAGTRERKITTVWHANYRLPTSITEANRTTAFTHDPAGNVLTRTVTDTSVTPNVARTWTYTYNAVGRVLTENGPRTDVTDLTTYTYYTCTTGFQCGQLNTITNAASQVTTYNTYNAHGQPTQITDANGLVTSMSYDSRQRMTYRCVGATLSACTGGELTHLEYWPTGLLKRVTTPDGSYIQYTYDNAHRLKQIGDGALNKIVHTLDNMGNRTAENSYDPSNALKRTHSRVFNTLNQLWKDVSAAGTVNVTTVFGYDNNGNQTTTNAPLSRNSTNLYDELNRLKQITDPNSGNTLFGYDANDNLTSVTDPRTLATSYTYTGFGDLKTQTSPDTGLTTNTYDSGGNLKTSTDARPAVTTYTYDNLNRVTVAEFKQGTAIDQTINYTYDAGTNGKGHLTGASDVDHTMTWTYDSKGRVTGKSQAYINTTTPITKSIGYGYNAAGQLTSLVLPSGQTISYGYNTNNQVSSVTLAGSPNVTILSNVTYDPFGPITGWTWGNGTASTSRTFDTDGKLTQVTSQGQRTFGYDDAFRITAANDIATPANSWTLGYDLLDRLNSATKPAITIGYTYDADGNRLTQTGTSASTYTMPATSNKLTSTAGALVRSYTYDAVGNALTTGATAHSYNKRGRMRTARLTSTSTNTVYVYNALGQRMRKAGGTPGTVYFMYDEAGHLVGEYNSTGALVQETAWLGDIPIATLRPKTGGVDVFYVHTDQLNTPRKVTNTSNQLRWTWDPTPFGEGSPNENPAALGAFKYNLRFPGQYFDVESNLNYNYFRDYDPAIGRYVESDPLGLNGGLNTFAYVAGNPIVRIDPQGLDYWLEDADPSESGLGLHQSVCVGKYGTANRFCISFGRKPGTGDCWFNCDGHVYQDRSPPGDVLYPRHRETDAATDRKIKRYMRSRLGEQRPWDAVGGENCRVFSQQIFDYLDKTYGGKAPVPAAPPNPYLEPPVY
jgi:RHS repeat-associated protein